MTHEALNAFRFRQVKDSPNIDTERPISRQTETGIYVCYGWSPYWGSGLYLDGHSFGYEGGAMTPLPAVRSRRREEDIVAAQQSNDDPHLRSTEMVTGYHIHAKDGEIGHVEDFVFEETDWSIHYLVVDTKNWWPGKKVLVSPRSVRAIHWTDHLVNLNLDRQKIKDGPPYDSAVTVDRTYEQQFHRYFDRGSGNLP